MTDPESSGTPASDRQNAAADDAAARFLRWAEERLAGPYETCCLCLGDGWDPYTERACAECYGHGKSLRTDYVMAEQALDDGQRARIGEDELLVGKNPLGVMFEISDPDDGQVKT